MALLTEPAFGADEEQPERGLQAAETYDEDEVACLTAMFWNEGRLCSLKAALRWGALAAL